MNLAIFYLLSHLLTNSFSIILSFSYNDLSSVFFCITLILPLSLQKILSMSCIFLFPLCLLTAELCHYSLLSHTHPPLMPTHSHTRTHTHAHARTRTHAHARTLSLSVYLLSFSDIIPYYPMFESPTFSSTASPPLQTFFSIINSSSKHGRRAGGREVCANHFLKTLST